MLQPDDKQGSQHCNKSLRAAVADLHRLVLRAVRADPICRRLMTMPVIGPVTALTYRVTIDDPKRFRRSRSVGAYLGLTPRRYQSGEVDRIGRITKIGDGETRTALFEAANVILRPTTRWSSMKAWAMKIAGRQGARRAKVALARRMAVTLHRIGSTNRISAGRPHKRSRPRNGARSMQGAVRASSHDLSLPVPEHVEEL